MARVKAKFYGVIAETVGRREIETEAGNVKQLLDTLTSKHGDFKGKIFDEDRRIRRFINIYVNGRDIRFLNGPETKLNEGDEVAVIPAVSGG